MGCGASSQSQLPTVTGDSVAIIGGGIAGATAAYYLAKKGLRVTIFEKNAKVGQVTSYGPAGVTMWKNVKKSFDFDGTISLSDGGLDGALRLAEGAAWSLLGNDPERGDMMLEARLTFEKFRELNPDSKVCMDDGGLLYMLNEAKYTENLELFKDDPSFAFYTKDEFESSEIYDHLFDGAEYHGIIHSKEEYYVDPSRMTKFVARAVESMGGKLQVSTIVDKIVEGKDAVTVHFQGKSETFSACVVALGAFPGALLKASGFEDDVSEIYGLKGYSITGRMPEGTLRRGVVDGIDVKFIRPFTDVQGNFCVRFGGCTDAYDDAAPLKKDWGRMEEFQKNQLAKKLFENGAINESTADVEHDALIEEGKVEVWTGIRPVNKHGRVPLCRWVNNSKRVGVVSGFGSNGFVMCWHAGPKVADMFAKAPLQLSADEHVLARNNLSWKEYKAKYGEESLTA